METFKKREYWEVNLPEYLEYALCEYIKSCVMEEDSLWDAKWCELYGSINSAFYDREITEEQAVKLRAKYLFKQSR